MELRKRPFRSRRMEPRKRTCRSIRVSNMAGSGMMNNVPDEIIGEILSWLPVKCVLSCKCVCKSWQTITQQRFFIEKHRSRGKRQFGYEVIYKSNTNGVTYDLEFSTNGFVLECKQYSYEYRIRNPATNQVLQVPCTPPVNLGTKCLAYLVFDSLTSKYKMISFHYNKGNRDLGVAMLTIGSEAHIDDNDYDVDVDESGQWRLLDVTLSVGSSKVLFTNNDDLFYVVSFSYPELQKSDIIRFTVDGKSSMKIKVPPDFQSFPRGEGIYQYVVQAFISDDGKLSLGFIIEQELHVWVLENYNKHIWSNKKIIPLHFTNDYPKWFAISVQSSSKGKMVVQINNYLLQYDIHSTKYTCLAEAPRGYKVWYLHYPSLASLKGMRSEQLSL